MIDISGFSEQQKYDFLRQAIQRARPYFACDNDADTDFQDTPGYINLLGVRGLSEGKMLSRNKTSSFDDTMFVIYKDDSGTKRVVEFAAALQYEKRLTANASAMRDIRLGMHKYQFGKHKLGSPGAALAIHNGSAYVDRASYPSGHGYRALRPLTSVPAFVDGNDNLQFDGNEALSNESGHNIHAGGTNDDGSTFSEGCQTIKGWPNFIRFMRLLEADFSIRGSIHNELPAQPGGATLNRPDVDGHRPVIYTLVEASFLLNYQLPAGPDAERAISATERNVALSNLERAYSACENSTNGGYFPIGANNCWHGGVHLPPGSDGHVYAPMTGEIVAFRLGFGEKGRAMLEQADGSKRNGGDVNFILLRHVLPDSVVRAVQGKPYLNTAAEVQQNNLGAGAAQHAAQGDDVVFYSLYMHLSSSVLLSEEEVVKDEFAYHWLIDRYELTANASCKRTLGASGQARNEQNMLSAQQALKKGDQYQIQVHSYLRQENLIWMQVKILRCEANAQLVGQVVYLPASVKEKSKPVWTNSQLLQLVNEGEVIVAESHFGIPLPVFAGDKLWRSGEGEGPDGALRPILHWTILAEKNLFEGCKGWKPILDQSGDNIIEDTKVLGLVPQEPARQGKPLHMDEVHDFYAATSEELQKTVRALRKYAVKFQTEWATNLDAVLPKMERIFEQDDRKLDKEAARKKAEQFLWWKKVAGPLKLPANGEVWHYQPLAVLSALAGIEQSQTLPYSQQFILKNQQSQPIPGARYRIVKAGNKEVMAEGVSDAAGKTERVYTEQQEQLQLEYL